MWDWWYSELPSKAKDAAKELGFTPEIWDSGAHVPYESEKICDVSNMQKSAAMYLGHDPIDEKCNIWWSEADPTTQKYAQVLGWDQHRWDDGALSKKEILTGYPEQDTVRIGSVSC